MKKIVFLNPSYGLPVPSIMGGAVEELETLLLKQNEKFASEYKFYFVQKALDKKNKYSDKECNLNNSEIVKIKCNKLLNLLQRGFIKVFSKIFPHKNRPLKIAMEYHNKAYNEVKKINPDVVIFEGQIDANIDKYIKHFGREKLFIHLHYQEIEKNYLDEYVNGFIAISKFIYDDYIKFLGDRAFRMNSYLIMNSVDEERFSKLLVKEEKLELRKKLGFEENDFVIIYCGRICEEKGVDKLIEAVIDTPPNIKLLIVGGNVLSNRKTVYWKRINNLISVNQNKIKSIGYIKNSEVYKYYQLADLHVVPSVWEEAAGLVVIEGQMAGVPQILTKSGGMVEYASSKTVILEKDNSLVENLAKNIVALSNNPGKLQAIKQAGLVNSKKYTKERYYNRFIDFLKNIEVKNEL